MTWNEIDSRLEGIGKDRRWLADQTPYTYDTIRNTLAPNAQKRSERMLSVLSRAIEDEEARRLARESREVSPGVFEIFQTAEQLDAVDRASRIVGAASLTEFVRDVIIAASERLLAETQEGATPNVTGFGYPDEPAAPNLKVADVDPDAPEIAPFPDAGLASDGGSSPGKSNGGNA